jgi:hypothetical protein
MKTASENRMEANTVVQTYYEMMPTFQKVANRKGLKEGSYKNSSRFQREGLKLKSLLDITSRTAHRTLRRGYSLLAERKRCTNWVRST